MMMIRLFGALTLLVLGTGAFAQDIRVRTAEHDRFTRMVVDFLDRPEWQIVRDATGMVLSTDAPGLTYDLSRVYQRITDQRIAQISASGDGLDIDLNCLCEFQTERLADGSLVIDLYDAPPGAKPPPIIAASPLPKWYSTNAGLLPGPLTDAVKPTAKADPGPIVSSDSRTLLVEVLARGKAQGLVDADLASIETETNVPTPPLPDEIIAIPEPESGLERFRNIRVDTQIDRDAPNANLRPVLAQCAPSAETDVAAWGTPEDMIEQIGTLTTAVTDDADAVRPERVHDLAKALLYLGFGAEAEMLLRTEIADRDERGAVWDIARVMDGPAQADRLLSAAACDTPVALWSVLASPSNVLPSGLNLAAVRRTFSALPAHLRRHLGPRLTQHFLLAGDQDTAFFIRDALDRVSTPDVPFDEMTQARLSLKTDDMDSAEDTLSQVAVSRTPQAAEALAVLITSRLDRGENVSDQLLADAQALVFELGAPENHDLRHAVLSVLIDEGRIETAFAELENWTTLSVAERQALTDRIQTRINTLQSDSDFLKNAMSAKANTPPTSQSSIREKRSMRLLSLGLPMQARDALALGTDIPDRAQRILLARSYLMEGDADLALSYLTGLSGADIDPLMAAIQTDLVSEIETETTEPIEASQPVASGVMERNRQVLEAARSARAELARLLKE